MTEQKVDAVCRFPEANLVDNIISPYRKLTIGQSALRLVARVIAVGPHHTRRGPSWWVGSPRHHFIPRLPRVLERMISTAGRHRTAVELGSRSPLVVRRINTSAFRAGSKG